MGGRVAAVVKAGWSRRGRKKVDRAELCKRVAQVPVADRENQRRLQYTTNTSAYLINRLYKEGYLRRALRRTRPLLSPKHMSDRLKYCVDRVQRTMDGRHFFDPMYDVVHLDEKWFYMKKVGKHVYILTGKDDVPSEEPPVLCRASGTSRKSFSCVQCAASWGLGRQGRDLAGCQELQDASDLDVFLY
ncbi:hypothetical protein PF003_g27014 [Phytophthora fragariae]|nr:hypothetical protein PF003_g27014 [Phytophthora fragariae]